MQNIEEKYNIYLKYIENMNILNIFKIFTQALARRELARGSKRPRQAGEARRLVASATSGLVIEQMQAPGTEEVHQSDGQLEEDDTLANLEEGAQQGHALPLLTFDWSSEQSVPRCRRRAAKRAGRRDRGAEGRRSEMSHLHKIGDDDASGPRGAALVVEDEDARALPACGFDEADIARQLAQLWR